MGVSRIDRFSCNTAAMVKAICTAAISLFTIFNAPVSLAQVPPGIGLDFVTIGDPGNQAYDRIVEYEGFTFAPGVATGRGSVDYEYRITRSEVTASQFLEFANTFTSQSDDLNELVSGGSFLSGASLDASYFGPGERYELAPGASPESPFRATWHQAAMYTNWLHNGRSSDPASILDGAYDISTFGEIRGGPSLGDLGPVIARTDQSAHHPDAMFWIPTVDEWIKAGYYDPNRYGEGEGGWWTSPDSSDTLPVPGLPGKGETSRGLAPEDYEPYYSLSFPVGQYESVQSPWGLTDLSGGLTEWTEDWASDPFTGEPQTINRVVLGSQNSDRDGVSELLTVEEFSRPTGLHGFRVASVVVIPSPSAVALFACMAVSVLRRKRV